MAKTTKRDHVRFALRRLAEDEETQAHLRTAALRLREAYNRATGRPPARAVEDKQLYTTLRQAATSLTRAARGLRPPPPPPKHRARKLLLMAATTGTTVLVVKKLSASSGQAQAPQPPHPGAPAPSPNPQATPA